MNITLTSQQEKIIHEELHAGRYHSVEEVVDEALHVLRDRGRSLSPVGVDGSQREAVREMFAFIEKNRVHLEGVSVKELIHAGHRL